MRIGPPSHIVLVNNGYLRAGSIYSVDDGNVARVAGTTTSDSEDHDIAMNGRGRLDQVGRKRMIAELSGVDVEYRVDLPSEIEVSLHVLGALVPIGPLRTYPVGATGRSSGVYAIVRIDSGQRGIATRVRRNAVDDVTGGNILVADIDGRVRRNDVLCVR